MAVNTNPTSTHGPEPAVAGFAGAVVRLTLALAPSIAEARAGKSLVEGGGTSSGASGMGSRGSRTCEHNDAAPITRSDQPDTPAPRPPGAAPARPPGAGAAQPSFFQRHPFLTGIAGGFLGSMLFSHLGLGDGMGSMFGGLLTMLLIGGLIFLGDPVVRRPSRGAPGAAG